MGSNDTLGLTYTFAGRAHLHPPPNSLFPTLTILATSTIILPYMTIDLIVLANPPTMIYVIYCSTHVHSDTSQVARTSRQSSGTNPNFWYAILGEGTSHLHLRASDRPGSFLVPLNTGFINQSTLEQRLRLVGVVGSCRKQTRCGGAAVAPPVVCSMAGLDWIRGLSSVEI